MAETAAEAAAEAIDATEASTMESVITNITAICNCLEDTYDGKAYANIVEQLRTLTAAAYRIALITGSFNVVLDAAMTHLREFTLTRLKWRLGKTIFHLKKFLDDCEDEIIDGQNHTYQTSPDYV